jgi:hypothetical protein
VRRALDLHVVGVGKQVAEPARGHVDRQDAVCRPVKDQGRLPGLAHRDDIRAEVLDPRRHHRIGGDGGTLRRRVPARRHDLLADPFAESLVEVVEVPVELGEPGVPVAPRGVGDAIEDLLRDALGVVVRLHEERFQRREECEPRHALVAVVLHVARELAGAHGEADEDHLAQVEGLEQYVQVGGERVVVVALGDLARIAEAAPVVSDDAISGGDELSGLQLPAVAVERIAVDQHHRLPLPLVLVVELDIGAVLRSHRDVSHGPNSLSNVRERSFSRVRVL